MKIRTLVSLALPLWAVGVGGMASAATYNIDWLQMAPTPFGSPPAYNASYNLPGVGAVQVTYAADPDFTEARFNTATLQNGSIPFGSDTYQWGPQECLARTNWGFSGNLNTAWTVTYTFSGTIPAGTIALDVQGLGRRDPDPGVPPAAYISVATVNQNGTFIGDYINGNNWGATQFTGGVGTFSMQNSVSGPGGWDPWWNTGLGLVRIDDPISSLTVHIQQTAGDGVGVNIGAISPTPGSAVLLGLGGLAAGRRRR